jgi:hypothetical protein
MYEIIDSAIGGYFELELCTGRAPHAGLIALNSARNALVYLIKAKKIRAINMPYLNCNAVAEAIKCFCPETSIHYYHVDSRFMPVLDDVPSGAPLFYVNYYGLQGHALRKLENYHVILDNAQAFYAPPVPNGDTIYCPRKFFGVSDGGYLQTNTKLDVPLEYDTSWDHAVHLLKRIDCGASAAYDDFQTAEAALVGKPLMRMSRLTQRILSGIDHEAVKKTRRKNFVRLHQLLGKQNGLFTLIEAVFESDSFVPLCYPYMCDDAESLRNQLIQNKIYIPIYWPELYDSPELNDFERRFVRRIVCLPIDQRYGETDMEIIEQHLKKV